MAVVKREAGGGGDRVFTAHRLVFNFDEDRFDKEAGERTVRVRYAGEEARKVDRLL
jgi:hypothetical protein